MFSAALSLSMMKDEVAGVTGCRSKRDASVTFGSRRVAEMTSATEVDTFMVDVLGRGARPEGVTVKCALLLLLLATLADTGRTCAGKVSIPNCCKDCCCC